MELQKYNPPPLPPSLFKTLFAEDNPSGWASVRESGNQNWFDENPPKAEPYQKELNSLSDFKVEPTEIKGLPTIQVKAEPYKKELNSLSDFKVEPKEIKDLPTLQIRVENCLIAEVPTQLYEIKEAIDESSYILTLEEDWDDEGGMPVDKSTFIRAATFLINYSVWLLENHRIFLSRPQIHPGPNASVDILWRSANYRMLINVPSDVSKDVAFYGDDKKNGKSIKSNVSPEGVEEFLAIWLKNLKH